MGYAVGILAGKKYDLVNVINNIHYPADKGALPVFLTFHRKAAQGQAMGFGVCPGTVVHFSDLPETSSVTPWGR